jgi:hypothetical protein
MSSHEAFWNALQVATPAEEYWKTIGAPRRGEYGGRCQRESCDRHNATWYNKGSGKYFCDECARAYNDLCAREGMPKLCEMHV